MHPAAWGGDSRDSRDSREHIQLEMLTRHPTVSGMWLTQDPDENMHLELVSTLRWRRKGPGAEGTMGCRNSRSELGRGINCLGDRQLTVTTIMVSQHQAPNPPRAISQRPVLTLGTGIPQLAEINAGQ